MPARSGCSGSSLLSTIFTGTRWVTFTKLPVELSGGSRAKRAPVAADSALQQLQAGAGLRAPASPARKRFDKLVSALQRQRGELRAWAEALPRWQQRHHSQLAPLLAPLGTPMDTLTLTPHGGWRVLLDSGAVLELGGGAQDEVLRRVRRLVTTLPQVAQQQGGRSATALEYADLRHSGGYALRLRGVTTVSAEDAARHNKAGRAAPRTAPASAAPRRATQNH